MGGEELFFILLVFGFFGLFIYKLANVFSVGRLYKELVSWISFIGGLFTWSMVLFLTLASRGEFLYFTVVFRFMTAFLIVYLMLHLIEVFFTLGQKPVNAARSRESLSRDFR